ncbi:MAG: Do family serine endopeptidase [Candidatus Omnitrophica bacterium]|nr:Do family serine endopeptidase [Candidatus Omnitrophota bacterium]
MFGIFKGKKIFLISGVLLIGVACGSAQTTITDPDKPISEEIDLRNAFVKVADKVGPSVVSISSERVQKVPGAQRFYFGPRGKSPFGDDFFDEFFKDFFGDVPEREYRQMGLGTGVIVDPEGYILTNEHVIGGAEKITVTLPDGRSFKAKPKGADPRSDLAIIKIDAKNLPFAELGNSDIIQTGEWVVAIGNPFGFAVNNPKPTVTVGVISALHRQLPGMFGPKGAERNYLDLVQTDAAINPGNSGGPLCDLNGKVIGINVAIVSTTGGYQGVGFAIPSNIANNVIGDLIKGKKIVYGWFGVTVQEITEDLAKFLGLAEKTGALVSSVIKDSPGQKAGIKEGDVIISIDGVKIKSVRDVLRIVGMKKPGEKAEVMIFRDKKGVLIPVIVGERPGEIKEAEAVEKPEVKEEIVWRGIKVVDITPELARAHNIENTAGVLVTEVDPAGPAAEAGLVEGDIIREINKTQVRNKAEYNRIVKGLKDNCLVRTDKGYIILKEKAENNE